jgi:hypothetical protein
MLNSMHAVSRAVRLPHGICNNLIFGSVWIRHHPEKPSARKAKQAKTRLRAAYDTVPSRASIEIAFTFAAKTLKMLTKRCVSAASYRQPIDSRRLSRDAPFTPAGR